MTKGFETVEHKKTSLNPSQVYFGNCLVRLRLSKNIHCRLEKHSSSLRYLLNKRARFMKNKNRRKAIFNWAAKGLFFLRGGAAIHTQATTKPCRRPLHAKQSYVRLKPKLIQNIVPF